MTSPTPETTMTPDELRRVARQARALPESFRIDPDKAEAAADAWEAEQEDDTNIIMCASTQAIELMVENDALRLRLAEAERRFTADGLTVIVEDWLHHHLDKDYRPTPRATMRWQWCKRPGYSGDHDCAACLMSPEEAAAEGKAGSGCECICHERVRSLVAFLLAALAPGEPKEGV